MATELLIDGKLNPEIFGESGGLNKRIKEAAEQASYPGFVNMSILLTPGVYILSDENRVLYVGRTNCLGTRIGTHIFERRIPFSRVEFMWIDDEKVQAQMERLLIAKFGNPPPYNGKSSSPWSGQRKVYRKKTALFDKHNMIDPEFDE